VRLSDSPRSTGLVIGLAVGLASWLGNASRTNLGIVSAFPDLLTVASVPLAMYFFIRARVAAGPRAELRQIRKAGWAVANTAAVVLAIFLACVEGFWFNQLDAAVVGEVVLTAIVVTVGAGYASVEVWARIVRRSHGTSADTD
jgi:hypothetical protein